MSNELLTIPVTVATGTDSGTVVGTAVPGVQGYDYFMVDATLTNTDSGATHDVYLQRRVTTDAGSVWRDWVHWPQQAASAGVVHYSATVQPSNAITSVGTGSDGVFASCATPALAANTIVGGHPGDQVRLVSVKSLVGDGLDQTQTVRLTCWRGKW
jgi:hypothetical protein